MYKHEIWSADLIIESSLIENYSNTEFPLTVKDMFTKFAWSICFMKKIRSISN